MLFKFLNGRLAVTYANNPISLALEVGRNGIANRLLVFNEQNFPCVRSHIEASLSHKMRTLHILS